MVGVQGGLGLGGQDRFRASSVSDEELGAALRQALQASEVAELVLDRNGAKPLLNAAGVKSQAALQQKARHVLASLSRDGVIELAPAVPEAGGWMSVGREDWIRLVNPSPTELGAALRSLLGGKSVDGAPDSDASHAPIAGPFSSKIAWLAFRTSNGQAVVDLLAIRGVARRDWEGLDAATEQGVFVTPPVDGWTLAVGVDLAIAADRIDVAELSRRLGTEVQWFATQRVVEGHSWAKAVDGVLVRAFEYVGDRAELTRNSGDLTPIEVELGIPGPDDIEIGPYPPDLESDESKPFIPDARTVMAVARSWSVDPSQLAADDDRLGWYGRMY